MSTYRLTLPYDRPPAGLTGNSRSHWRTKAAHAQQLRADVLTLARQAGLHQLGPCRHVTVALTWAPGDRRRRDEDNLWVVLKICCDALARGPRKDWVGLDLVPDDTAAWMTKRAPFIAPPPAKGMWLDVTVELDLSGPESTRAMSAAKRTYSSCSSRTDALSGPDGPSERDTSTPTERTER